MTEKKRQRYSPEVKERAVRLFHETRESHSSEWAALVSIASKIGCSPETLRNWVRKATPEAKASADEKARIKELEREVKELRRANEILKKASAYFAQAELDRPHKKW